MATYNYAYDMTVDVKMAAPDATTVLDAEAARSAATANIYTKDDGFRPYDDIAVRHNGKDINVGEALAELDMYKTVFSDAFAELGIDINEIVEKKKFLTKLSS